MKDIVNIKFIKTHQEEILKLGDIVPYSIMKYINYENIEKYFHIHKKNNTLYEEIETIEDWIFSEKIVLDDFKFYYDENYRKFEKESEFPEYYIRKFEEYIELLEDWVNCYPEFKGVLNKGCFDEYINNEGIIDQSPELRIIEEKFHEVIMQRVGNIIEELKIELPHITMDLYQKDFFNREEFPVPGMYGGFYYYLDVGEYSDFQLNVDSWSRISEGSGQTHIITVNDKELVDEGYV